MADFGSALWNKPAAADSTPADPVTRSLRLAGSHYLTKTFSSSGNRKTYTIAFWVKRSKVSTSSTQVLFSAATSSHGPPNYQSNIDQISFRSNDTLELYQVTSSHTTRLATAAIYRDVGAWMHCCFSVDTTLPSSQETDRVKIFVNGVRQSVATYTDYPDQNHDSLFNKNEEHKIGEEAARDRYNSDVLISDFYFIDGTALSTPVGNLIQDTGYSSYKPKAFDMSSYSGNSFHLKFEDSSDIGSDSTSNSNDWSTTGISSHDILLDVPTNNYCTLNPLDDRDTPLSEGNLRAGTGSTYSTTAGTFGMESGKWIWSTRINSTGGGTPAPAMVPASESFAGVNTWAGSAASGGWGYALSAYSDLYYNGSALVNNLFSASDEGEIAWAVDIDAGKAWLGTVSSGSVTWYNSGDPANGTNATFTFTAGTAMKPAISSYGSGSNGSLNFGQDATYAGLESPSTTYADSNGNGSFGFQPPNSFLALCSGNLDAPAVTPSEHFDVLTYNGNSDLSNASGSTQNVTGVNFDVGMAWIKDRDNSSSGYTSSSSDEHGHYLFDTITGTSSGGYNLDGDVVSSGSGAYLNSTYYGVSSFSAGSGTNRGITVDEAGETNFDYDDGFYTLTERYVAWLWKLGSTGSSSTWNSSYTAPNTEHYNASAGVATLDVSPASSGNLEVAHSLSAAPEFFFVTTDGMADFSGFPAFHKDLSSGTYLQLDGTSAASSNSNYFPSGAAHADYIKLGSAFIDSLGSGFNLRIWAFTGVEGYSKFGSYVGNLSTDGTFIYTGFRPRFIMVKNIQDSGHSWYIHDTARSPNNYSDLELTANSSGAEYSVMTAASVERMDINSNGFKLRGNNVATNANGRTHIYAAFAESPFKHANAR